MNVFLRRSLTSARQSAVSARTFASSRAKAAPAWQKFAAAGAFCLSSGLSYSVLSADTVLDIKGPEETFTITISSDSKKKQLLLQDIDLIVCDMAGTTIMEYGIVYQTLRKAMNKDGLNVGVEEMHAWHGAKKEAVIAHFARAHGKATTEEEIKAQVKRVSHLFEDMISDAYFAPGSRVRLVDKELTSWMAKLQERGTRVALDTGYPPELQKGLMKMLGLDSVVDSKVSAYQVAAGRPAPFMVFKLMEDLGITDVRRVAKVGDTVRDIEEGRNAGCGLVVGVLTGADSEEKLLAAGADIVVPLITDLGLPPTVRSKKVLTSARTQVTDM